MPFRAVQTLPNTDRLSYLFFHALNILAKFFMFNLEIISNDISVGFRRGPQALALIIQCIFSSYL